VRRAEVRFEIGGGLVDGDVGAEAEAAAAIDWQIPDVSQRQCVDVRDAVRMLSRQLGARFEVDPRRGTTICVTVPGED
jgi:hypothetical protein